MACLTTNQLALYLTTFGLSANERHAFDQHLAACPKCRDQMNRMQQRLRDLDFENQQECESVRDSLEACALDQLQEAERGKVLQHTGECHTCNSLLIQLSTFFPAERVATWNIPIPPWLAENLEEALEQKFGIVRKRPVLEKAEDKIRELAEGVKDVLKEIRLSLSPFEPALGFRGEEEVRKSDFVEVEHNGGDLVVNAGVPGVIVELYSDREKYLDDGESDAQGKVMFPAMKPGLYKIKVCGHKID